MNPNDNCSAKSVSRSPSTKYYLNKVFIYGPKRGNDELWLVCSATRPFAFCLFHFCFFSVIFYCLLICYKDIWIKTYCQCYKQFLFNQQINRLRHNSYASFIIQESGVHRCEKINSFSNYHGNQNQRYLEQWQSW